MPRVRSWLSSPVIWPGAVGGNGDLVVEPVLANHLDGSLEHEPGRRVSLAHLVNHLPGCERPCRTARKALGRLDLSKVEHREHLVTTSLGQAHSRLSC